MISFARMAESLGVQAKLALAFALVLCVGLIVTGTGFYSVHTLSGLVEKSAIAGELRAKIQELKVLEQRALFIADEESLKQRSILLSQLIAEVNDAIDIFDLQAADDLSYLNSLLASREASYSSEVGSKATTDKVKLGEPGGALMAADKKLNDEYEQLSSAVNALMGHLIENQNEKVPLIYYMLGGVTLFTMLMSAYSVWFISHQLVPPLKSTVQLAERIASGDLVDVGDSRRKDEIGQLQSATRRMAIGLRNLVGDIGQSAAQLVSSSSDLSAICAQAQIDVECQKLSVAQVSTAVNELVETVQAIAKSTEEAATVAVLADEKARGGESVVNKAVDFIEHLSGDMAELGDAMERLQNDSAQINKVVDVIKAVAEQTNLLALNAAIEAARAGEQGRGFAVVADEVRALAMRTQQSTKEIERLVVSLQQGSEAAGELMQRGKVRTHDVVGLAKQARAALLEITQAVAGIQAMNYQIAAGAEQQGAAVVQINQNMLEVHKMADESAIKAGQTMKSSKELAHLGSALQKSVDRFQL